ncbi:MAG TPA: zf-HC2 domain-containing protein, partial [Ktedonobacterales bacterium]
MNQNHHIPTSNCAAFAPLLPLAAHHLLSETADARLRAHLAGCARCRSALTDYDVIEEALRRSFAPRLGASPPFTREELMQTLDHHTDDSIEQPAPSAPPIAPAAPPRRLRRRYLAGLPAVAALLAAVFIIVTLFAAHGGHAPGSAKTTTNASLTVIRGSDTELHDISMVSPTEGWAVGFATPADKPNAPTAVLMHYARGVWTRVQTAIHERVSSVSMVSATDGWAVGEDGLVLHFDGKTWKQTASIASPLERVQMVSATDGWAIGTGIWHYNGHNWTAQPLPASLNLGIGPQQNNLYLLGLSMLSASDGWAVGYLTYPSTEIYPTIPPGGVILHYTGGHWIVDTII